MLKPYSFLLYLLAIITCLLMGMGYAGFINAGKNQGLAGGAIVFSYGLFGAMIGLFIALYIANKMKRAYLIRLNMILAISIVGLTVYFYFKHIERQKEKNQSYISLIPPTRFPFIRN